MYSWRRIIPAPVILQETHNHQDANHKGANKRGTHISCHNACAQGNQTGCKLKQIRGAAYTAALPPVGHPGHKIR